MTMDEMLSYVKIMKDLANAHNKFDEELGKSFNNKEEIMNKFLVMTDCGNAKYAKDMTEAKEYATEAILAGYDKAFVYELKMTAGIEKPKVEFKEV